MERIELFDRYIADELAASEKAEFDCRLQADGDFASEFRVYLFAVRGICQEVEQDNLDFGIAMRKLSGEQLCEIIGKKESASPRFGIKRFRPWVGAAISVAASLIIMFTISFNLIRDARNTTSEALALSVYLAQPRGTGPDYSGMSDEELIEHRAEILEAFAKASDEVDLVVYGEAAAKVNLLTHHRAEAREILEMLVARFKDNSTYSGKVLYWERMIELLK